MALLAVASHYRTIFGTTYGMGENFASRKDSASSLSLSEALTGMDFLAGGISFDLITAEVHEMKNDVTTHAVEQGVPPTDHIQNRLREGKITGMISNYSLKAFVGSNIDISEGDLQLKSRVQKAYSFLKELWRKQVPVDIVSVLEVYKNVAITSIKMKRDSTTGDAQYFEISFREMKVRKLDLKQVGMNINLDTVDSDLDKQALPETDMGRQTADAGQDVSGQIAQPASTSPGGEFF